MKKFEYLNVSLADKVNRYHRHRLAGLTSSESLEKFKQIEVELMNELGAEGWELVMQEHGSGRYVFKREIG